jgi:hypothetical protein
VAWAGRREQDVLSLRGSAILSLSVGFVVSILVGSGFLLKLVREDLHFQCSFLRMGGDDPGSFYCADGISYMGVGVGTYGVYGVILLVALVIASVGPATAGMLQSQLMAGISILPIAMFSWSTWYATSVRSGDQAPGVNYWVQPLLPVTVVLVTAVVVILAAGLISRPGVRRAGFRVAMALFVAAVLIQPGSLSAVAVALGALAAAMLLERRVPNEVASFSVTSASTNLLRQRLRYPTSLNPGSHGGRGAGEYSEQTGSLADVSGQPSWASPRAGHLCGNGQTTGFRVAIRFAVRHASRMKRWGIAAVVTVSAVILLAACTGGPPIASDQEEPSSVADRTYRGTTETSRGPGEGTVFSESPQGTWLERNQTFAVTTWGSSSCPSIPTSIELEAKNAVAIHFEPSPHDPCTADMAPTTHEFTVPSGSGTTPLTITLTYADWDGTDSIVLD